jgi:biopolymer transport protein TolQ
MWLVLANAGGGGGLNLWTILMDAGPISKLVFVLLIGCSVLSIAVIVERWIVMKRAEKSTTDSLQLLDAWAMTGQWSTAREEIGQAIRETTPLFSVLRAGVAYWAELVAVGENRMEVLEANTTEAVNRELKLVRAMLRANMSILANIASVAPFIGLFGTVVGIIMTFDSIAKSGNMGQDLVASGIADALVATAMGLFAAIPAVIAYNFFSDRVTHLLLSMEEVALERIYFLMQRADVAHPHLRKEPMHVPVANHPG